MTVQERHDAPGKGLERSVDERITDLEAQVDGLRHQIDVLELALNSLPHPFY
ncbi:MAG: hypothetical protein JRJ84_23730, partial [Deltaproteobacteria bacterium]|nr:hypothetical protein [Deltaproteobacteria bacterium]